MNNKILLIGFFYLGAINASEDIDIYSRTINLASGYKQLIKESPVSVSVITSKDIKRIGALTIEEVLETVPGIHVTYINGYLPVYNIRGVGSSVNTPVLIYLDGIAINNSVISSSYYSLAHLTGNIDRIEIIKGPGSAIYGADAFSGVINIISKETEETEAGVFSGSFDSFGGWLNHGGKINDLKYDFSIQAAATNGSNDLVNSDRQSAIDNVFNTNLSLAPGSINRGKDEFDIKLSLQFLDSKLYLRYIEKETQNGVGIIQAIDNKGNINSKSWISGFQHSFGSEDFLTKININYTGYKLNLNSNILPKGTLGGVFTDTVINNVGYTSHDLSAKLSTIYKRFANHIIYSGIGFEYDFVNNIHDERNFTQGPFNMLLPLGSVKDTNDIGVDAFAGSEERYNINGFIQDEWNFVNDFRLISGVRLDYFSDFGFSINPRGSLIWDVSSSLTTKIMYGRAFRAPSFFELYSNEGILITGNDKLKPETTQNIEFSIQKNWNYSLSTQLNVFWYETDNLITDKTLIDPSTLSQSRVFINSDGVETFGFEMELSYQIFDNLELDTNYTYLKLQPKNSSDDYIITTPSHEIFAAINWGITEHWAANLRSTSIIGRKRASSDDRNRIKDYTTVDFTLNGTKIMNYFNVTFKVNNLLSSNIRDPSIDGVSIPGDYPLDGRSFYGILSVKF